MVVTSRKYYSGTVSVSGIVDGMTHPKRYFRVRSILFKRQQPHALCPGHRLGAAVHTQLAVDIGSMPFNGAERNMQTLRNFPV